MGLSQSNMLKSCGCSCSGKIAGHEHAREDKLHGEIVVFVAKEIVTMDPSWPSATAVAVQNGRVLTVGSMDDMKPWIERPGVHVRIDTTFKDLVLTPGFIEPHIHPMTGGTALRLPNIAYQDTPNPYGDTIPGCKSREACIEKLTNSCSKYAPGEVFIAWGWDSIALNGSHLHRDELDGVSTTNPVLVWDCSMHSVYANTLAMKQANLTPVSCKGIDGVNLDQDGQLSGIFRGVAAATLFKKLFKRVASVSELLESTIYLADLAKKGGITTMAEMLMGVFNLPVEERLYDVAFNNENMPVRCVVVRDAESQRKTVFGSTTLAIKRLRDAKNASTERLVYNNGVKFMMDDSFLGLDMQMNSPGYIDGHRGVWNSKPGYETFSKMLPYWKAGFRIHVHTNGTASQDALAKILTELQATHARFDHRFCFEHYGMSSESLTRKLKALGASASVNPFYHFHRADINEKHIGIDRAHTASRLKTLVDIGVPCALHTDTPVAPPRPLEEMWIAVNRFSSSGICRSPEERITPYQAMRMKTVDAAYVLGMDDVIGSIESGKFADFTVLYENPLQVGPERIKDIQIWGTVSGGVKYPRDERIDLKLKPPTDFMQGLLWLFTSTEKNPFLLQLLQYLCKRYNVEHISPIERREVTMRLVRSAICLVAGLFAICLAAGLFALCLEYKHRVIYKQG